MFDKYVRSRQQEASKADFKLYDMKLSLFNSSGFEFYPVVSIVTTRYKSAYPSCITYSSFINERKYC